ncbi:hypothetical protein [Ancylobacter defluvii]|uniref:hypothetical protein n=1 Tax=Ancylobacter defluvii TaxID=1282440 RepID=UPI0035A23EA0
MGCRSHPVVRRERCWGAGHRGGGRLVSSFDAVGFVGTYVGRNIDGSGTVTVSGTDASSQGSTWANAGLLSIGHCGTGSLALTIRDPCDVVPSIELGGSDGRQGKVDTVFGNDPRS